MGYPAALARAIGHPVMWMGQLVGWLDRRLNRDDASSEARRRAGAVALLVLLVVVGAVAFIVEQALLLLPFGLLFAAVAASTMLAQRSLVVHVGQVADALDDGGIDAGREAVAHIVGRDTAALDQAGVARAAIESLAENFSDGVVAPTFCMVIAGLPGAALYKAINTADSMIGHRTERYQDFGRTAAQLDDIVNLPASRLTALLIVAAAYLTKGAVGLGGMAGDAGGTARNTPRPMPAIPKRPWPARSVWRWPGRASITARSPTGPGWATGGARRRQRTFASALELYSRADGLLIAIVFVLAALIALI